MKIALSLTMVIAQVQLASAADFRGMTLGEDCRSAETREAEYGSALESRDNERVSFRGLFERWNAEIIYFCRDGRLQQGVYMLEAPQFDVAVHWYGEIKALLSRKHGLPAVDMALPECINEVSEPVDRESQYVSVWEHTGVTIEVIAINVGGEGMIRISYARSIDDASDACGHRGTRE